MRPSALYEKEIAVSAVYHSMLVGTALIGTLAVAITATAYAETANMEVQKGDSFISERVAMERSDVTVLTPDEGTTIVTRVVR